MVRAGTYGDEIKEALMKMLTEFSRLGEKFVEKEITVDQLKQQKAKLVLAFDEKWKTEL